MKSTMTAIGTVLIGAALAAVPANAQMNYGAQPAPQAPSATQDQESAQSQQAQAPAQNPNALLTHQPKVSREASKPIAALEKAVNANDAAGIQSALAAAQAAAKTPEDRYSIALLQLKSAASAKNSAGIAAAIESLIASGAVTETEKYSVYLNLAKTYDGMKVTDRAMQAYQQALQLNPNSVDATAGLAEMQVASGRATEALALLEKGIQLQSANGGRASETWYKRAVAVAYKAKLPAAVEMSRKWITAYPTADAWQNSLAIYQNLGQLDDTRTLDLLRLKRTTKTMTAADYFNFGDIAIRKGLSGEAKAVLEEGFAANVIKRSDASYGQLYTLASQKTQGDRASLPAAPGADSNARQTLNIGDAYFGYGDYAKALEFYRAALGREGADPNLINLHIGMALALQGDKAGAATAFNSAGGAQAELAKFWMLYTKA